MPWFLRISQSNWLRPEPTAPAPADALKDLRTVDNKLSVWLIHEDGANLRLVITALAANRDTVANLDYALMPIDTMERLGLTKVDVEGDTKVQTANRWHRDLVQLRARDLAVLVEAFIWKKVRIPENEVRTMLSEAITQDLLDPATLSDNIQQHLRKRGLLS